MTWGLWPREVKQDIEISESSLQDCDRSLKRLEQSVCDLEGAVQKLWQAVLKKKNGNHD